MTVPNTSARRCHVHNVVRPLDTTSRIWSVCLRIINVTSDLWCCRVLVCRLSVDFSEHEPIEHFTTHIRTAGWYCCKCTERVLPNDMGQHSISAMAWLYCEQTDMSPTSQPQPVIYNQSYTTSRTQPAIHSQPYTTNYLQPATHNQV